MRIGVISDTHIPGTAESIPDVVLEDLKNTDMVIHSGDFVEAGILELLCSTCKNVIAVAGNMDCEEIRKKLPDKTVFKAGGFKIGVMHGIGHPAKLIDLLKHSFKNDGAHLIVFGHSHLPQIHRENDVLFFNPGSPTDKVFSPYNSYGIVEITDRIELRIVKI